MTDKILIESIKGTKNSRGKRELLNYLSGKSISRKAAMLAKCFECTCYYADGKEDCNMGECPLYPWMPFAKIEDKPKSKRGRKPKTVLE